MINDFDEKRVGYMDLLNALILEAIERRDAVLHELCPPRIDISNEKMLLKQLAASNQKIASMCDRMRLAERQAGGRLGVPALISGGDIPNPVRTVLAFLISKCLSQVVFRECRTVGDLAETAAGNDSNQLLEVHDAFSKGGTLRPHIHYDYGRTISEISDITLKESAFRQLLGLAQDSELETLEILANTKGVIRRLK